MRRKHEILSRQKQGLISIFIMWKSEQGGINRLDFKATIEFQIFSDAWNFFKKYYVIQEDDEWWENMIAEADVITKKYSGSQFTRELIMVILNEIERKAKEARTDAETQ